MTKATARLRTWRLKAKEAKSKDCNDERRDAYRRLCPGMNPRVDDRTVKSAPASETSG